MRDRDRVRDPLARRRAEPHRASSVLVNAYASDIEQKIGWDFEDETPGNDARGFAREGSLAPMVETHLANTVLTNGARFYVDHAHPEYSTPECLTPSSASCTTRRARRCCAGP